MNSIVEKYQSTVELIQKEFTIPATLNINDNRVEVVINGKSYITEFYAWDLVYMIEESAIQPKKLAKTLLSVASSIQLAEMNAIYKIDCKRQVKEQFIAEFDKVYDSTEISAENKDWALQTVISILRKAQQLK